MTLRLADVREQSPRDRASDSADSSGDRDEANLPDDATAADRTATWIGGRLRSIREQKQLSLADVERLSGGDFGPSTVGAYERGERTITVPRLDRLADFYGVSIEQFLPRPTVTPPVTTRTSLISEQLTIDITKLGRLDGGPFITLMRFVQLIRAQRDDHHPSIVTLRGADAMVIAAMLAVPVDAVVERLTALDLLETAPSTP